MLDQETFFIETRLVVATVVDIWTNGNKLMLLGIELGIVALFGLVLFEPAITEVWTFVLIASVVVTFIGLLHPTPA